MTSSINTNVSAYYAQQNLKTAGAKAELTIARLSSGNRLIRAADDVAALSIGTILKSNVNTLKTALSNAQQAQSLLQVADGGLKNIGNILGRQKALAVQANSGTLSNAERSFLNQEFQNLTAEISRLVDNTKFNAVALLDGSLSKAVGLTGNVDKVATTTVAAAGSNITLADAGTNGEYIEVNGSKIYFTSETIGSDAAKGKVQIGADLTTTAANLAAFLNSAQDARVNVAYYTAAGGVVSAVNRLGDNDGAGVVSFSFGQGTFNATANNTGGLADGGVDGLARNRVFATGEVSGTRLRELAPLFTNATTQTAGIDVSNITDNAAFLGKLNNFTVSYLSGSNVTFSVKVGEITYTSDSIDVSNATAASTITLTGSNGTGAEGGNLTISLASTVSLDSQGEANDLAAEINAALSSVTFLQARDVSSFTGNSLVTVDGVQTATLVGTKVDLIGSDFSNVQIEEVRVTAPGFGSTDAKFEVRINGEWYQSFAGIGSQIEENTSVVLSNVNDKSKTLVITTGTDTVPGGVAWKVDTQGQADALAAALEKAFGVTDGKSKLQFQTGATASDNIGIEIKGANVKSLFDGKNLDILTANNAIAAGEQIDKAIAYVTALRADVGALQSRFDYAQANLDTSIQNQDAARGGFLDANISEEATTFAQAQVLLQASISVLAQANQLPQNLLKLIG